VAITLVVAASAGAALGSEVALRDA
jgi:hypothetical protein